MKRLFLILVLLALLITPMGLFAQSDDGLFITEDGSFAVFLPDGWVAEGNVESLYLSTSADTLSLIQDDGEEVPVLEPGEVGVVVTPFPVEIFEIFEIDIEATPVEILQQFMEIEPDDSLQAGEVTEVEVGGLPAAMVRLTQDGSELGFVLHRLAPEVVGFTGVVVGDNAFDDNMDDILVGLGDVNFSLPLEESYEDGPTSVMYPTDWTADDELFPGGLVITNVPEFFELEDAELQSDEVVYIVFDVSDIAAENSNDLEATATAFVELFLSEGDEAGEPATIVVNDREVAGLSVTNEIEGEGEGGIAVTEGLDGQTYGILYATADNEGDLIIWTGLQILLSVNNTEGIEG